MSAGNKIAKVLLPVPLDEPLDYIIPDDLKITENEYVRVPFGRKTMVGVVWQITSGSTIPQKKLKPIQESITALPAFTTPLKTLVDWMGQYTLSPKGSVLKMALSVPKVFEKPLKAEQPLISSPHIIHLSSEQQAAGQVLCAAVQQQTFKPIVLEGVTGSGKTEVYFEAIHRSQAMGKQSLVLLPEIALSAQWLHRFQQRFGYLPTEWHSNLTPKQRRDNWQKIALGIAQVVVGARSALFLPYQNLECLIVDEEHDHSYKQESGVLYQARDMAVVRAKMENIPIILSSATPSLETVHNIQTGKYDHVMLPNRYKGAQLPTVQVVDMRSEVPWISKPLQEKIQETLDRHEQILLFLNRRGYAPLVLCQKCGDRIACIDCSSWLVYHKKHNRMICHHCGYQIPKPTVCPACHDPDHLISWGPGVERIAEQAAQLFPGAKVAVVTSDTMQSQKETDILQDIADQKIDIIVGSQIMAKGHHFPHLTLVGVIDGDMGASGMDVRGGERTYQILQQVGGRAGRSHKPGHVIIQTYLPEHPIIQALEKYDMDGFIQYELEVRERLGLPPYGRLAALILSGRKNEQVEQVCRGLARHIMDDPNVEVLGPTPASLHFKAGRYRWRFLIKASKNVPLQTYISRWVHAYKIPSTVQLQIDIDPYQFM